MSIIFVHPNDSISSGHDNFPNDLFDKLIGSKKAILRNNGGVICLFHFDKSSGTHPQIVYMPPLENISKILPEQYALESTLRIYNINPRTVMNVCHDFESFPQRSRLVNMNFLQVDGLE